MTLRVIGLENLCLFSIILIADFCFFGLIFLMIERGVNVLVYDF